MKQFLQLPVYIQHDMLQGFLWCQVSYFNTKKISFFRNNFKFIASILIKKLFKSVFKKTVVLFGGECKVELDVLLSPFWLVHVSQAFVYENSLWPSMLSFTESVAKGR